MEKIGLFKAGFESVRTLILPKKNHSQILEPLTTIIRLAILTFIDEGTKISISNNSINYQTPTIIQGTLRWANGDKRSDLHNLYNPIQKVIDWYSNDKDIKLILNYTILGLNKLKNAYNDNSNLVRHSLEYYIYILESFINNVPIVKENFHKHIEINNETINSLKTIWNESEIKCISLLLSLSETKMKNNEEYLYLIKSVESILFGKDEIVRKIIYKLTTELE